MTCERFAVHVVDFPFSDSGRSKRRPALALTDARWSAATGNVVLAMITSARQSDWPGDCAIGDRAAAGLTADCKVRPRLLTLATSILGERIGCLSHGDAARVEAALRSVLLP